VSNKAGTSPQLGHGDIFAPHFTDETTARKHLEALQCPDGPFCPHCGSFNATRLEGKKHRDALIQCNDCRQQYTANVGTIFERSKVSQQKWLLVNQLLVSSKKGMSSHQISRMIGVTDKTAWFMCHRIREAMKPNSPDPHGSGPDAVVEADETYRGGKQRNGATRAVKPKKAVPCRVRWPGDHRAKVTGQKCSKSSAPTTLPRRCGSLSRPSSFIDAGGRPPKNCERCCCWNRRRSRTRPASCRIDESAKTIGNRPQMSFMTQ
jgi:transposase-like protein